MVLHLYSNDNCFDFNKKIILILEESLILNIYFCQVLSNSFKDLSKLKIIKICPLRNIDVKIPQYNEDLREENTILEIYDNSNNHERYNGKNKNYISINFFQAEKCAIMLNILEQQKANCFQLEYLLFDSYIDAIERKISII